MSRTKKRRKGRSKFAPMRAQLDETGEAAPEDHRHESMQVHEPVPGASPGTLLIGDGPPPKIVVIDYGPDVLFERELKEVDEVIQYLTDEHPSITWIDVRGISNRKSFE